MYFKKLKQSDIGTLNRLPKFTKLKRKGEGGFRIKQKKIKKNPLVSIITVTLNSERYLEDTLESIQKQTMKNYEHIIIDGGSKDSTLDIIKKHSKKISYWVSESDKGIYDAFNKGLLLAKGKYIGFVNSDDLLTNDGTPTFNVSNLTSGAPETIATNDWLILFEAGVRFDSVQVSSDNESVTIGDARDLASAPNSYPITFKTRDQAGNLSDATAAVNITIDKDAPATGEVLDLQAAFDTGISDVDDITNATEPVFTLSGLAPTGNSSINLYYQRTSNPVVDTFLFFSISFYATGVPWVTLSLGDLAVKILVAIIMLIPFRMLLKIIKPIKV